MFLLRKKIIFISSALFQVSIVNYSYAQQEKINYEKIQSLYSTNYSNLKKMYVSFFYPKDSDENNKFLIDINEKTEDEKFTIKEPLGYDIRLSNKGQEGSVKVGHIDIDSKDKDDE